ncbi:uncharacterized protein LOC129320837 isoform X2 [Prosopis cineraria]|uniref:uncharacterized protein LOC129320837 isoform X2 n=1 Tax=Prosopis cineraria TaxID=364024 RepID=UPI00240E9FC6|nr:uncharacterized protein LOC129320837 isoform X2 [Prosopis cineraria]
MPGTILVSVLEFMGLPSSSTSIKVSLGKTEHLISEKGDFSFPLNSLRDDFIVKLQDADGNEISRTGFHTKPIVEKGVWEDIFPLGHGHLRLKLQFILNDEDRDRIRMMRQSALKKKHDELLGSSPTGAESGSTSVGNAALTFRNDEVSESPKRYLQLEAVSQGKSPVGFQTEEKTAPKNVLGAKPHLMQLHPNSAVQYKEISSNKPMSEAFDLIKLLEKGLIKEPSFGSPFSKDPQSAINSEEVTISFRSSNQNEVAENNLMQSNPSSVRKMISAFEMQTGLAQDMRSHIKSPPTEHQSSIVERKASSKAQHSRKGPVGLLQGKSKDSSLARELKQAQLYNGGSRAPRNSLSHGKELLNEQTDSNSRNKFKLSHKSDGKEEKYGKDFGRTFAFEAVKDSWKMPEKHSDRNHLSNLFDSRQDSRSNPNKEEKRENAFQSSRELCIKRGSPSKLNSGVHLDNNYCPFECSGAWIFPEEPRKFCLTTGGKNVMALLESLVRKRINPERSLDSSILENMEKNAAYIGPGAEVKHAKIDETKESKSKNTGGNADEVSGRPVKQLIKGAIIIGFGIFVLLTRQRKGR